MPAKNKGPLTKIEKFYLENNSTLPAKQLAEDIGRSTKSVEKYIDAMVKESNSHIAKSKGEDTGGLAGDLMGRNERYGVTVMNESASMAGESSKSTKNKFNPSTMHKIKGD